MLMINVSNISRVCSQSYKHTLLARHLSSSAVSLKQDPIQEEYTLEH